MFTSDTIWGIDIGDSCIKAVKLKKSKGLVSVEDFGYIELDLELKENEGVLATIQDGLERLASRKIFAKSEVCISISAKSVNSRFISVPLKSKEKQMEQAIEKEVKRQIPFKLEEVQWGYYRMPDRDDQAQIALFAARNEQIEEILNVVNEVGLSIRGIQVPGLALFNFIDWTSEEIEDHLVVLDFGEKTTDLIVVHDGAVWLRSLPLSGSHITQLLEKKFRITTAEANTLKHEMERSSQKDKLFRVIEPKLKDLVVEIKRSINFRKTQVKDLQPTKFFACGGSSQLPGVAKYFTKQLRLDSFNLNLEGFDFANCPESEELEENIISYGVAFGLALQGLEETEAELNLIPSNFVMKQTLRAKRYVAVAVNIMILLMVLMMYLSGSSRVAGLEEMTKKVTSVNGRLSGEIGDYEEKAKALPTAKAEGAFYADIVRGNDFVAKIYNKVQQAISKVNHVYLVRFSLSTLLPSHFYSDGQKLLDSGGSENVEEDNGRDRRRRRPVRRRDRGAQRVAQEENTAKSKSAQLGVAEGGYIALELFCIGDDGDIKTADSKSTISFQTNLLEDQMFEEKADKTTSITNEYKWGFNLAISVADDPFSSITDVQDLRKEKEWSFTEDEMTVNKLRGHELKMGLVANLKSVLPKIEEKKNEEEDD